MTTPLTDERRREIFDRLRGPIEAGAQNLGIPALSKDLKVGTTILYGMSSALRYALQSKPFPKSLPAAAITAVKDYLKNGAAEAAPSPDAPRPTPPPNGRRPQLRDLPYDAVFDRLHGAARAPDGGSLTKAVALEFGSSESHVTFLRSALSYAIRGEAAPAYLSKRTVKLAQDYVARKGIGAATKNLPAVLMPAPQEDRPLLYVSCMVPDHGRLWEVLRQLEASGAVNVEVRHVSSSRKGRQL